MQAMLIQQTRSSRRLLSDAIRQNPAIHCFFGKKISGLRFHMLVNRYSRYLQQKKSALISEDNRNIAVVVPVASEKDQQFPRIRNRGAHPLSFQLKRPYKRFIRRVRELLPAEPHLCFLLLISDTHRNGISSIIALREELLKLSELMQLSVYMQTTSKKTKELFERFGFVAYADLAIPGKEDRLFFLRKTTVTA